MKEIRLLIIILIVSLTSCELLDFGTSSVNESYEAQFSTCGERGVLIDIENLEFEGILCLKQFVDIERELYLGEIEYKYKIETFFGEPVQRGIIKWTAGFQGELNSITIRAKIMNVNGDFTGWYYFYEPLVFSANEWSTDVAGSPDWDEMFENKNRTMFLGEEETKSIFRNGFYLKDFYPYTVNNVRY